jgi:hypothetical protein
MMVQQLHTELFLRETQTDGHAPIAFVCNDLNIYYCKYLNSLKKEEITCLAYEVVASKLLVKLGIPTPNIAAVTVADNTLNKKEIKQNKRLRVGNVCFGSKEVVSATEVQSLAQIKSKAEYNKLSNPADIIKIAIFDLWINNSDRGRNFGEGFNYNLLLEPQENKYKLLAFDNAFIFGGINQIGIFNPSSSVDISNKIHLSPYYKSIVKHISHEQFIEVVNNFIPLLRKNYGTLISNIIKEVSVYWEITPNLDKRILDFISSKTRIDEIEKIIIQSGK